jgi:hypothetical protein
MCRWIRPRRSASFYFCSLLAKEPEPGSSPALQEIEKIFSVYGKVEAVRFRSISFDNPSVRRASLPKKVLKV